MCVFVRARMCARVCVCVDGGGGGAPILGKILIFQCKVLCFDVKSKNSAIVQ